NERYPAWLARCDQLFKREGHAGIIGVWTFGAQFLANTKLATYCAAPVALLERGAYNPAQRNSLAPASKLTGIDLRNIASREQLRAAVKECAPDALLCEADFLSFGLEDELSRLGCRVWVFDECWSDAFPSRYTRSWLSRKGYVDATLWELVPSGV